MPKLWEKGYKLDPYIECFTVGEDYLIDRKLIESDIYGNIAHARMLHKIGILSSTEFSKLKRCLIEILKKSKNGTFTVKNVDEDVHTAVENYLTNRLGKIGKKIHTGRSRNDQALLDIRLYARGELIKIFEELLELAETLAKFASKHKSVPMPGRTHTQRAMPSSVGLWAAAFAESLMDDIKLLKTVYSLNNQCPLGSAASYGVPLPIDRQMVSDLLGFEKVQNNVLYANNSRGKIEAMIVFAMTQISEDLSKLANDLIFFSIPELGYFSLPKEYCPGSSIMPQKLNPCPLEIVRARSAGNIARLVQLIVTIRNLPSGYNRDFQETKKPLMESLESTMQCIKTMRMIFNKLRVNRDVLISSFTPEIFAADMALKIAVEGKMPFRDAYRKVAGELESLKAEDPVKNIMSKRHMGATGNLGIDRLMMEINSEKRKVRSERKKVEEVYKKLKNL
ncbi:MAG: argininosuccinate lyase [Candidatus Hadarchaeales archaeon]